MGRWTRNAVVASAALVVGSLSYALWAWEAQAFLHGPQKESKEDSVAVTQVQQQALLMDAGDKQHLVLQTSVQTSTPAPSLGWVVPLPSVPEEYGAADKKLLTQLELSVDLREHRVGARAATGAKTRGAGTLGDVRGEKSGGTPPLKMYAKVDVGPYEITPLEASGSAGIEALQKWFEERDLKVPPKKRLRYYVDRKWTFLAVEVKPAEGKEESAFDGTLRPLRVTFETDRLVYPMKLSTGQGRFSTVLYVLTPERLENEALIGAATRGFSVAGVRKESDRPGTVRRIEPPIPSVNALVNWRSTGETLIQHSVSRRAFEPDGTPEVVDSFMEDVGAWDQTEKWHLRVLYMPEFGSAYADADRWREDVSIPGVKPGEKLTGSVGGESTGEESEKEGEEEK